MRFAGVYGAESLVFHAVQSLALSRAEQQEKSKRQVVSSSKCTVQVSLSVNKCYSLTRPK